MFIYMAAAEAVDAAHTHTHTYTDSKADEASAGNPFRFCMCVSR